MGVRRETASGYLKAAGVGIRPPRRWGKSKPANEGTTEASTASEPAGEAAGAKPANEGTTDFMPRSRAGVRHVSASIVAPYVELVRQRLEVGRNGRAIYEEFVDTQGYTGSYISVRRFVRALRDSQGPEAKAVIHTAPDEEAQVDYGEGPMVRHPETGKYRRTRMFVMTLGYSRKSVRLLCWKSSSRAWAHLHEEAFRRLGGVARTVVLDNLREGGAFARRVRASPQSALPGRAGPLRVHGPAGPSPPLGQEGQGGVRGGPRAAHAPQGPALRVAGGRPGLPRRVGGEVGGHPNPRHHQAPGGSHVLRGASALAAPARRALPVLRLRRAGGAPGQARRGGQRVLLGSPPGTHRPQAARAVGQPPRPPAAARYGATAPGAHPSPSRPPPHTRGGQAFPRAAHHRATARACRQGWT